MRRVDQDGDACISFYEFEEALTPICVQVIDAFAHPTQRESLLNSTMGEHRRSVEMYPEIVGGSPLRTRSSNSPVLNRSRASYEECSMPPSSIKRPKSAHNTSKRKHK
jgi:hypothetical protein